jgi:tetratricopeptide (TPR) repeat protein
MRSLKKSIRVYAGNWGGNPGEDFQPLPPNILPPVCKLPEKHRMPYRSLGNGFVGRVRDLWDIDGSLRKNKTTVVQGVGVVSGMGGVGKTQLAVEYVHRFGRYYPGGVFWVEADQGLSALLVQVYRAAGIDVDNKLEEKEQLLQLWQILSSFPPALIVFDNFPEKSGLEAWLPPQSTIHVLVTTRRKDLFKYSSFSLDVLTKEEGIKLLNSGKRKFTEGAAGLVEAMGGLPLAIELAKNFLNLRNDLSPSGLLEEIKKKGEIKTLDIFACKYENQLPTRHSKEVAATFQLSWDITPDFAKTVLQVITLLAPAPVPRRILKKILGKDSEGLLEDPVDDAVGALTQKFSLTEYDEDNDPACHRLISAFVRTVIKKDRDLNDRIVQAIYDEMARTTAEADTASLRELEKVIPHADYLLTSKILDVKPEQAIDIANNTGWHHSRLGRYRISESYRKIALQIAEENFKPGDPKIASCFVHLGHVLNSLGEYDKAIVYYEKALESGIKTFGKEHPDVAIRWNNLGAAYKALGQYKKAIEYYEKALTSDLKTYGPEHPQVAIYRNNLGLAYYSLGQYDKAIEFYEKANAINIKHLGEEHPRVAATWNNLGSAYDSLGQYEKAIEYYEKALESDLKTYGPEHPQVAIYRNNLGGAYYALGQYEKAISYFEKALKIFETFLGKEHPYTRSVIKKLEITRKKLK